MYIKKVLLLVVVGIVSFVGAAEEVKYDVEDVPVTSGIEHHYLTELGDAGNIIQTLYPHKRAVIESEIVEYFKEIEVLPVALGASIKIMAVIGNYNPFKDNNKDFVLFFDKKGRSTELRYQRKIPIKCGINTHVGWLKTSPRVTVLYSTGELVHFKRTGSCCNYRWPAREVITIDNPLGVEKLTIFDGGECLYYSENQLVVLDKNGEELWEYPDPDSVQEQANITITNVCPTYPELQQVALCTSTFQLVRWRRATLKDRIKTCCDRSVTGNWTVEQLQEKPYSLQFDRKGELVLNRVTPGQRRDSESDGPTPGEFGDSENDEKD